MKKNVNKLIAASLVTTMGLGYINYPVYAQEETDDNVNIKFTKNDRLKITNFDHIYSSRESRTSFVL